MDPAIITEKLKSLNINPAEFQDDKISNAFNILFQIIEDLQAENGKLKSKLETALDEIERLKGNDVKLDSKFNKDENTTLYLSYS